MPLLVHLKDIEIKDTLEVTTKLHLKIQMVMSFLVQKNPQNNSIKVILEEALYVALKGAPKIPLLEAQKVAKKCEE